MALEIEKKFLIEMPNIEWIKINTDCTVAHITQTYLGRSKDGYGNRVRAMRIKNKTKFFHTAKKKVSGFTRIELEKEISRDDYNRYLYAKEKVVSLKKTRYIVKLNGLRYEIDVYPFWKDTAIMEIELENEKQKFEIPSFIKVIGDVTNNMDYTNHSLAKKYSIEGKNE